MGSLRRGEPSVDAIEYAVICNGSVEELCNALEKEFNTPVSYDQLEIAFTYYGSRVEITLATKETWESVIQSMGKVVYPSLDLLDELLQKGTRMLMAGDLSSDSEQVQFLRNRWPGMKVAEIAPPSLPQKLEVGATFAPHLEMKVIESIAKKCKSMREVGGWLIQYDTCREMGEPFAMDE